jgi:hypothetical protein
MSTTQPTTQPTIEVIVGPTGETTVKTSGFSGPACRDASRFVEQALGDKAEEVFTPEFFQPAATAEHVKQQG